MHLMNRLLIAMGLVCIAAGLTWTWLRQVPWFRLPGDIVVDRPGLRFFFPLTTMLLISVVISLVAMLLRR